jgi:NAD(P)H dehydrogenase (quinone)
MNYLLILAHPNKNSFSNAITYRLKEVLENKSHKVDIIDLYEDEFDPVLKARELDPETKMNLDADILAYQKRISWADEIVLIYPLWWMHMPAIIKGFIDRVFTLGFAYDKTEDGKFIFPLNSKRGSIVVPMGLPKKIADEDGTNKGIHLTQGKGLFAFCGIKIRHEILFHSVPSCSQEERIKMLDSLADYFI